MSAPVAAVLGVLALLVAGFVRGGLSHSSDPELVFAAAYGLAGAGLLGVLAAGIALGIRWSRD